MTIRKLPESVIVRIAAGEVIERPASVVKELVENSLDAGATSIRVRVEDGGLKLIEVSDNGCGIPREELAIALERHATSKIGGANDLSSIGTLGFRGEALATIAAAGRLTVVSRCAGPDAEGWRLDAWSAGDARAAAPPQPTPAARDRGTTMIVRDLFCRTPVRLKFMKSPGAELARITEIIERIALARPDVAFALHRDEKLLLSTSGSGDLRAAVGAIHGPELARELIEIVGESGARRVRGLAGSPHQTRRNRSGFRYNLAGRPIEDKTIVHAISSAYEGLIPRGLFPIVFLTIDIPLREVDVNVHPAKAEVRFQDSREIHRLVSRSIRTRLQGEIALPRVELKSPGEGTNFPRSPRPAAVPFSRADPFEIQQTTFPTPAQTAVGAGVAEPGDVGPMAGGSAQDRGLSLRFAGEIAGRYILAEDPSGLVILDQHAAHERVLFDELMSQAQNGDVVVSPLLMPLTVDMPPSELALIEENIAHFRELGFEIEVWPGAAALRSVPAVLTIADARGVLREIVDSVKRAGVLKETKVPYERIAREACKGAVKGTQRLEREEATRLVEDLVRTTDPYNCPHGRPTMIRLTVDELDRRFGRG